jgi:hypothetical protein
MERFPLQEGEMTNRKLTQRAPSKLLRAALGVLVLFAALPVSGAVANHTPNSYINRTVTITSATSPENWSGVSRPGANALYDFDAGEPCFDPTVVPGDTQMRWCDITLLHVNEAPSFWDTTFGGVRISIAVNANDYDLQIYESDASATRGAFVGQSGNPAGLDESFLIAEASGYYLIQVIYFATGPVPYDGTAAFETFTRSPVPPDVDDPPGLQDFLASDPSAGFRSYSEPHIAQNPVNPDMFVAGSKFYNRDPDSLAEYEFKIGSFVSFDGAQDWTQLGQIKACPLAQAPPETWPLDNTCYPEDVPNQEGPEEGGADIGEEYITSDIWMQFDDEGNAYAMVLDAPPFSSGNGWGMTLHKWESVSPADISSGNTWSDRIVINAYPSDDVRQELFLDDKNTFAVNNAGPDGDGQTGIIIACWGQNIQPAKQQIVCERSTDGGESWPDTPIPISGLFPLVIGVHVVADPNDPLRFYAVWLQYASSIPGTPATMEFTQSLDGGMTWLPSATIATLDDVPRQFPNQQFRNLSIPIMAVGPAGEIYVSYAEYLPTSDPDDEDGMHADIRVIRNDLMGLPGVWTTPTTVNQDGTRADQFQPYVAVNPDGQVEVAYFDRRHDTADNFYVDTYLSRSNDMGTTFTDTRVSHDMSSPELNAPVSSTGLFFGDYQGLVVDQCFAYPFFQDTHLANSPSRDPEFDHGLPRSQFQEAFAWRVPNTPAFGGSGVACEKFPEEPTRITGGGQVPGNGGSGVASFGFNIRADANGASGNMNVKDHGTGQHIKLASINSVTVTGNHVTVTATCRIGNGPNESCQIDADDNAEPGAGADEFQLAVGAGASYSGGGTLNRGNVQIDS